jgi:hypothetical protein
MCFGKSDIKTIACPHFRSDANSALCSVLMDQVKNVADAEIKFCMSQHYEACYVYVGSIRRTSSQPIAQTLQ